MAGDIAAELVNSTAMIPSDLIKNLHLAQNKVG
jgi:hypothetical protein